MTEVDFIPKKFVVVSETEPAAFEGLIWYNPNEKLWRMYKDGKWQILIPFYVGDSEPVEKTDGMLWYDTYNDVMKIWDEAGGAWQRLGVDRADVTNFWAEPFWPNIPDKPMLIKNLDNYYLYDDWDDNQLASRKSLLSRYRPVWTQQAGSFEVVNGELKIPNGAADGSRITTPSSFAVGIWEFKHRFGATNTTGNSVLFGFMVQDVVYKADGYYILLNAGGMFVLRKYSAGEAIDLLNISITPDTNQHVYKVARDNSGNFELFMDGESKGTVSDTEFYTSKYLQFMSAGVDEDSYFDDLKIY